MEDLKALLDKAGDDCRQQRCEEAVSGLEEAVRLTPSDPDLHYRLGVCYSGGCGLRAGRNAETGIAYLRHALKLLAGTSAHPLARARVLDATAHAYLAAREIPPSERMPAAMECCREAALLYRDAREMEEWAREEFNLGNICCDLAAWQDAVVHYEKSLEVRTAKGNPAAHAATLQNLATAYRELPAGERSGNVRKSILCSFGALRIYRAAGMKSKCGALHNNIGNAYLSLPAGSAAEAIRNVGRALGHFERALSAGTSGERPLASANTQLNRGEAYLLLAALGVEGARASAEACFLQAEERFIACGRPDLAALAGERGRRALEG